MCGNGNVGVGGRAAHQPQVAQHVHVILSRDGLRDVVEDVPHILSGDVGRSRISGLVVAVVGGAGRGVGGC